MCVQTFPPMRCIVIEMTSCRRTWTPHWLLHLLCPPSGLQCHLPESNSEGWSRQGPEAAGAQPDWEHHLVHFPVHHQRTVWVWQAHIHCSAHFPGTNVKRWSCCFENTFTLTFGSNKLCENREVLRAGSASFWSSSGLLCLQILMMNDDINAAELDFLLRYPVQPGVTSPVEFLSNHSWGGIKVENKAPSFFVALKLRWNLSRLASI